MSPHKIAVLAYGSEDPIYYIDARTGLKSGESDEAGENEMGYTRKYEVHDSDGWTPPLDPEKIELKREIQDLREELAELRRYVNRQTRDSGRRNEVID